MITVEQAKNELREYRDNIKFIKEKQDDLEELREILEKTTTRLSLTKTDCNSMSTDKFSDGIDKISKIEKERDKELSELLIKKFVIDKKIEMLGYPYRDVLFMRYSRGKSWRSIAIELDYSEQDIYRKHGKALQMYAKL